MQWLLDPTLKQLQDLVSMCERAGFPTGKGEIVSAGVLGCSADEALAVTDVYRRKAALIHPRQRRGIPVLLRIPSPISLRIDGLITECRERGQRAYRYQLVGGLITAAADLGREQVEESCEFFRSAEAKDAAIPGRAQREVLLRKRPRPGARQHLETVT